MVSKKDNDFADFNKLVSKANKRLRRLAKKGWKTRAYKKAVQTGGKFHNRRGASYKEKAREYQRVKNFLNSELGFFCGQYFTHKSDTFQSMTTISHKNKAY